MLTIVKPGMLTTVQDLGRWGRQSSGVPVAGPMDEYSHRLANLLLDNSEQAAALEVTLIGPEIVSNREVVCAVAGAAFRVLVGDEPVPLHAPFVLGAGVPLRFGVRSGGARATLAIRGGVRCDPVFGSRATSLIGGMGPFGGRPLAVGDRLPIGDDVSPHAGGEVLAPLSMPAGGARLRVMAGPQDHLFTPAALETLCRNRFTIGTSSNRMGYRLEGPPLLRVDGGDVLSDATPIGAIQVPASGQPILLMADRQTTGGYPKIATVIGADLPVAGQLAPGDWLEFSLFTRRQAADAMRARFGPLRLPPRVTRGRTR